MARPTILMPGPMADVVVEGCEARFDTLKLWKEADPQAAIAERAPHIKGVALGGSAKADAELMKQLPALEIVANFGVGYDTVDTDEAQRRNIIVTHTPNVLNDEVADTTIGLLLMTLRELPQSERYLRAGKWTDKPFPLTRTTLRDRTIGIVGMGRIGKAIARRIEGFGVPIAYHSRSKKADVSYPYYATLAELAREVDTLILITPGGAETRHMVDAGILKTLGPRGVLINVARGSVVDEEALIKALQDGTIQAAGLDVFDDEPNVPDALIALDNVVLLPHVASASVHTRRAMGQLVVDNLVSWFDQGKPITPVPETPFPRK